MRSQAWRDVPPGSLIHHSVFRRTKNLILDHYSSNRRLLRRVPEDARPVFDPPFFYSDTPRQAATKIAEAAFYHVPIRAAEWFTVRGETVVRSDDWLGPGQRRADVLTSTTRTVFVLVATEWLLSGRRAAAELGLPATVDDYYHQPVPGLDAAQWVIEVLIALEPYVPALRNFTPSPDAARAAPAVQTPSSTLSSIGPITLPRGTEGA